MIEINNSDDLAQFLAMTHCTKYDLEHDTDVLFATAKVYGREVSYTKGISSKTPTELEYKAFIIDLAIIARNYLFNGGRCEVANRLERCWSS